MGQFRERIFVVTGANSGVGKSTTRSLATRGARLVMVCRSRERGEHALEEIRRQTGNDRLELLARHLDRHAPCAE